ncbi:DUF6527 family protein [Rhodococcus pyridinivorans]|uniref:DUF6527 family protein n=1 Tax=Rhodococcus TaxID=1827 RepID=UPI001C7D2F96|nr:DUF6527 family protein [Rhodococcus sp. DMU2021]MBX4171801.1 hypothetical protein [Rhodococcus sp. DMU2021]
MRTKLRPVFTDYVPVDLEEGLLYVSMPYATAVHLCACGCGGKTVTPLAPSGWKLTFDGTITLRPSIGNGQFRCRSHYLITGDTISWLSPIGTLATQAAAGRDRQAVAEEHAQAIPIWRRWWRWFRKGT